MSLCSHNWKSWAGCNLAISLSLMSTHPNFAISFCKAHAPVPQTNLQLMLDSSTITAYNLICRSRLCTKLTSAGCGNTMITSGTKYAYPHILFRAHSVATNSRSILLHFYFVANKGLPIIIITFNSSPSPWVRTALQYCASASICTLIGYLTSQIPNCTLECTTLAS